MMEGTEKSASDVSRGNLALILFIKAQLFLHALASFPLGKVFERPLSPTFTDL